MATTHSILADISAGISELKKNPMAVVEQGDGAPVAILNRNRPVFYAFPAKAYEFIMDKLDSSLRSILKNRLVARLKKPHNEPSRLNGMKNCYKIKLRQAGYRLVYQVRDKELVVVVVAVGKI